MRCAGKMKHLLWCFMFTEMGAFGAGSRQIPAAGRGLFVFIGMFFVGLRWGSVCEAMLVYCDDAFDLRRLFKSFRTQIYLTRWNVF